MSSAIQPVTATNIADVNAVTNGNSVLDVFVNQNIYQGHGKGQGSATNTAKVSYYDYNHDGKVDMVINQNIYESGKGKMTATNIADVNAVANGHSEIDVTINQKIYQQGHGKAVGSASNLAKVDATTTGQGQVDVVVNQKVVQTGTPDFLKHVHGKKGLA